jgi:hypothetical protein
LPEPNRAGSSGWSLPDLCELIWDAETRFGLLDWTVAGVNPWLAARFSVYKQLASATGLIEGGAPDRPLSWPDRVRRHARLLSGSIRHNPFRGSKRYDVLVFESPRTAVVDSVRTCPYTHDIAEQLVRDGKRVLRLDPDLGGVHDKPADQQRRFLDAAALESGLRFRFSRWRAAPADLAFLRRVEEHFTAALGLKVALAWLLEPGVARFRAAYSTYRRLLSKRQPTEIYCVAAYGGLASLVAAAKDLGIRATEVQHGAIDRYHFGYSFGPKPSVQTPRYLPDRLVAWKADWNRIETPCPVEYLDHGYWERLRRTAGNTTRRPGRMIVLSQPVIRERLARYLVDRIHRLDVFDIVIRLHPHERYDTGSREAFRPLCQHSNVRLDEGGDLHQALAEAEYQVGVFSMALFEGVELGCQTLLVPLPGIERVEALFKTGTAKFLDEFIDSLPMVK